MSVLKKERCRQPCFPAVRRQLLEINTAARYLTPCGIYHQKFSLLRFDLMRVSRRSNTSVMLHAALYEVEESIVIHTLQLFITRSVPSYKIMKTVTCKAGKLGNDRFIKCAVHILFLFKGF